MAFYKQIIICQQWLHTYCRQLVALPAEDNDNALSGLERQATTTAQQQLCQYVRSTWVESTMWPPSTWSVFQRSVRSNNDVEGWHRRLNQKASCGQLNLYLLLQLLGGETQLLETQLTLLKESTQIRHQCQSQRVTARHFTLWDRLVAGERTPQQMLRAAAYLLPKY